MRACVSYSGQSLMPFLGEHVAQHRRIETNDAAYMSTRPDSQIVSCSMFYKQDGGV